jgi:hypothetical protein
LSSFSRRGDRVDNAEQEKPNQADLGRFASAFTQTA